MNTDTTLRHTRKQAADLLGCSRGNADYLARKHCEGRRLLSDADVERMRGSMRPWTGKTPAELSFEIKRYSYFYDDAAHELGISRAELDRLMRENGLDADAGYLMASEFGLLRRIYELQKRIAELESLRQPPPCSEPTTPSRKGHPMSRNRKGLSLTGTSGRCGRC